MTSAVTAALFAVAIGNLRAAVEDKITKSFNAQPGGQLVVDVDRGSIEIKTADRESVEIEVARKAGGSQSKAEKILKDHVVTTAQDGNNITVRAEYKGGQPTSWLGNSVSFQRVLRNGNLGTSVLLGILRISVFAWRK